eukprot:515412-Pelagomonas_calceolata.AAC.1
MNVPILRRDFGTIKVVRSTWDRAHKDSIRATLVSSRGASTIREKPVRNCSGDILRNIYSLLQESLILASITIRAEPNLPLLRALTQELRPT